MVYIFIHIISYSYIARPKCDSMIGNSHLMNATFVNLIFGEYNARGELSRRTHHQSLLSIIWQLIAKWWFPFLYHLFGFFHALSLMRKQIESARSYEKLASKRAVARTMNVKREPSAWKKKLCSYISMIQRWQRQNNFSNNVHSFVSLLVGLGHIWLGQITNSAIENNSYFNSLFRSYIAEGTQHNNRELNRKNLIKLTIYFLKQYFIIIV